MEARRNTSGSPDIAAPANKSEDKRTARKILKKCFKEVGRRYFLSLKAWHFKSNKIAFHSAYIDVLATLVHFEKLRFVAFDPLSVIGDKLTTSFAFSGCSYGLIDLSLRQAVAITRDRISLLLP